MNEAVAFSGEVDPVRAGKTLQTERLIRPIGFSAGSLAMLLVCLGASIGRTAPAQVDSIRDAVAQLKTCWKPPPASQASPDIDITVIVSFNRDGEILGRPKITYQSEQATDNDRLMYRIAVMEALQRCTPMPFTEGMAGAIAGHPFAVQFRNRKHSPQPAEKRAWLIQKIL